ncbi:YbaK/EbsC family protein [Lactonifactor longoviformis]|uniref:YbaK/EbsC family protein n=1 Tax=Lactonifactor longoviformis TaxID=341220 RepID=UPI00210B7489|nr:YbaK/EbsC family protein [Lactonifactor longoviformis]MCQ4671454.1 YbaK/EbsC family protein [Lactonifactor longoviformis]
MSIEKVRNHLKQYGLDSRIMEFDTSSATVELAAQAVGCEPARIGKTMSFKAEDKPILILTAGDAKIDNVKYKNKFHVKAKMLAAQEVEPLIGHGIGGVCPFGINEGVDVYLDVSLKRFPSVFPGAGNDSSAVELTMEDLERCAGSKGWIDVCKGWE